MLSRVAFVALARIAKGEPAFSSMLRRYSGRVYAARRRAALEDLYTRRFIKRGPYGPMITKTGRDALEAHIRVLKGEPYSDAFGVTKTIAGERLSLPRSTINRRIDSIKRCGAL